MNLNRKSSLLIFCFNSVFLIFFFPFFFHLNSAPIKIISPKKDEDTTDWYDKNKFKTILTTIDNNKFNHKCKIDKLKFNGINNLINNIKNNTISETDAKQKLNELDEIKKAETKNIRLINGQKMIVMMKKSTTK